MRIDNKLTVCDKCGEEVPEHNDVISLEIRLGNTWAIMARSRHLLPTENCVGSPSRAQYIEGQPKDTRSEYPYEMYWELQVRRAYAEMQAMHQAATS
jgi:hypothetical protein